MLGARPDRIRGGFPHNSACFSRKRKAALRCCSGLRWLLCAIVLWSGNGDAQPARGYRNCDHISVIIQYAHTDWIRML